MKPDEALPEPRIEAKSHQCPPFAPCPTMEGKKPLTIESLELKTAQKGRLGLVPLSWLRYQEPKRAGGCFSPVSECNFALGFEFVSYIFPVKMQGFLFFSSSFMYSYQTFKCPDREVDGRPGGGDGGVASVCATYLFLVWFAGNGI